MKTDFPSLGNLFFDISNIFAVSQKQTGRTRFETQQPRPTDALLLFANTTGVCYQPGFPPFYIPHGALVYMPQGSHYIWENSPPPGNAFQENLLFEFTLRPANTLRGEKREVSHTPFSPGHVSLGDKVYIVTTGHIKHYEKLFRNLIAAFNAPNFSPLALYGAAYEIFSTVSGYTRLELENPINTNIIKPSLKYLTDDSPAEKSIKEIAGLCNVSIGYFEKLFRQYAGKIPLDCYSTSQPTAAQRIIAQLFPTRLICYRIGLASSYLQCTSQSIAHRNCGIGSIYYITECRGTDKASFRMVDAVSEKYTPPQVRS